LISKIADPEFVASITKNQTAKLIKRFASQYSGDPEAQLAIKIMERVNLMTPENIHLNSFMYEPILDMSSEHLADLYREACELSE
jgi:hypothetical protein